MMSKGEFVKLVLLRDHKHTLVTYPPIVQGKLIIITEACNESFYYKHFIDI